MVDLAAPFVQSLLLGSLYTMMALGLTITYKVTKIPNFAHAEYVTVGAYTGAVAANAGFGLIGGIPLAFAASAGVALAVDELVFKPLFRRGATPLHLLVASIGAGLVVRYVLSIVVAAGGILSIRSQVLPTRIADFGPGAALTDLHLAAPAGTAGIVIALHLMFTRTRIGKGMRAMASNFDLARASGLRTAQIRRLTWLLAGGLAGLAGAFWSVYQSTHPEFGWRALLWIFAASILAGMISFYGTVAGGYIVAFAENFGITILNAQWNVNTAYKPMIALVIIVAVFLIRPTGFAGLTLRDVIKGFRDFPGRAWGWLRGLWARISRLVAVRR